MTTNQSHQFADDAPRSNPWQEDTLGFATFSKRLAEALVRQRAPNGYVFGLHGEWGSGKSTVLNFVRSHFSKWREEKIPDMESLDWFSFEPWIVSGHQDLAAAFFKVLSEHLADDADRKATVRRFTRGIVDVGAGKIIDAAASMGKAIDHTGGLASKAAGAVAKLGISKAAEKWLSEPSVQRVYDDLVIRLRASDKRFIVFIDDIDRLTSVEIRSLMQMVKTVGRLPNVTYCLSYDRQIVWGALRELAPGEGARSGYAEKIVQHEAEVPVPSRTGLMRMLEASLPELPPTPTGIRWMEILQAGLNRWIRHPRDVVRLANAMHFAWAALRDEVDPYDVLCMEAMRLFDRKLFDWVRDNRDLLLGEGYPSLGKEDEKEQAAEELGRTLSEGARADAVPMLRLLFPNKSNLFGRRRGLSNETWNDAAARRGLATKAGYTAYFSLSPSPHAVPRTMVERAARADVSREEHRGYIMSAVALEDEQGRSLAGEYFQELGYRLHTLSPEAMSALFKALVDESVAVFEANGEAATFGPASAHHVLMDSIMSALGPDKTGKAVIDLFATSEDVGALCALYVDLGRSLGVMKTDGSSRHDYLSLDIFEQLGSGLLPKIEAAAEKGQLTALPHYYEVARAWAHLRGTQPPREWLADEARRNGHTLAKLSKGLLGTSHDGSTTRFGVYRSMEPEFYELYDLDAIEEGCRAFIGSEGLDDVERARIRALQDGLASLRGRSR